MGARARGRGGLAFFRRADGVGALVLAASLGLPWLRLGDVWLSAAPWPATVAALRVSPSIYGLYGVVLATALLIGAGLLGRSTRMWALLAGLAGLSVVVSASFSGETRFLGLLGEGPYVAAAAGLFSILNAAGLLGAPSDP